MPQKNQDPPFEISSAHLHQNMNPSDDKTSTQPQIKVNYIYFHKLFRFANRYDYVLMLVGTLGAIGMGISFPAFAYVLGSMTDNFSVGDSLVSKAKQTMYIFLYVGVAALVSGFLMFACWMITGERQTIECKKAYLRSLLIQQIGWFDTINQNELTANFEADTQAFQGAVGEKISTLIMTIATLISGFVFAFVTGWLMTVVVLVSVPVIIVAGFLYLKLIQDKDKKEQVSYSKAGAKAQQAIAAIKTIKQLNGQQYQSKKYKNFLQKATENSVKYSLLMGLGIALISLVELASYSLGFWYGAMCIMNTKDCPVHVSKQYYTPGHVVVVFFCIVIGGFNLIQFIPTFKKISKGKQAAARIYSIIDRQPTIQSPPNSHKIQNLLGIIEFEKVTFSFPKDPTRKILNEIDLKFDVRKIGIAGESGCGKSTILQLILRFYDPESGKITIDGHDIKTLDIEWLRKQFGYVGQQPILFSTTIKQNLILGDDKITDEQIGNALKSAQIYDFVYSLPNNLQTFVGYGGNQLSGGEKQRLAIARAILRKPKIMLFDQATSALDRRNQKLIQQTLQKVTQGIKTITIAHRTNTIKNSDLIYLLRKGGVQQKGLYKDIKKFKQLQQKQKQKQKQHQRHPLQIQISEQEDPSTKIKKSKSSGQSKHSQTQEQLQKQQQQRRLKKYEKVIFKRLFGYAREKIGLFVAGILCAAVVGVVYPVFSVFLAKMMVALLKISANEGIVTPQELKNIELYALIFLILGIVAFIFTTLQTASFNLVGECITKKIRQQTFNKILKMPIPWFDKPQNSVGILTARLSSDCQVVNTMTTTTISVLIQNITTFVAGIAIAFSFQWRTSLVALAFLPFMIFAGVAQMAFQTGFSDKSDAAYKKSTNLLMQAMIYIRTVYAFGYEKTIIKKYDQKMIEPNKLAIKKSIVSGIFYGFSQLIMFPMFGVLFFVGAIFIKDYPQSVTIQGMFVAIYSIMFAGMTIGNNSHFLPDIAGCKSAAANLFQIQDSQDQQQSQVDFESKMLKNQAYGDIRFQNVQFKYQSRQEYVFKNLNLLIKNGLKSAFVGRSGCGKSTIMQLLLRFYELSNGRITINGIDIRDFQLRYLRSQFGIVSQEPVLFNGTFAQNIKYNLQEATIRQIKDAAMRANALSFIQSQNQPSNSGFNRNVGVKGSHISGGQKQKIAIARIILRNPWILLLDEATSALDRKNQQKVQETLDLLMHGKTSISIAHRIETIKNSDMITMFQKGKILQSGNYHQLIEKKGHFYKLQRGDQFL